MARPRKKTAEENITQTPASEDSTAPAESSGTLDRLTAEGKLPPLNSQPDRQQQGRFTERVARPDPFGATGVALSDSNDGPKIRLYRSQKFQQMAIQFDEKPDEGIRQRLRDDGWTWRGADGVWTKQFGDRPGETHRQAEEFFQTVANELRQARGLEPVTFETHSR